MIGIVLAAGNGTRMWPLTKSISKHLLPIHDKPMIYYPITTLMFAGAREIVLIATPQHVRSYRELLGDGSQWGLKFHFIIQETATGIADCFRLIPKTLQSQTATLILGDNFFFGIGLGQTLRNSFSGEGALCLAYKVANPSEYGVVVFDQFGNPSKIVEKPEGHISHWAIPGIYWFDHQCYGLARSLKPSQRGELEITDLLKSYLENARLQTHPLPRGTTWLDAGTPRSLLSASSYVAVIEERQGLKIGCPEEVALHEGYIDSSAFNDLVLRLPQGDYKTYLQGLI